MVAADKKESGKDFILNLKFKYLPNNFFLKIIGLGNTKNICFKKEPG